MSRFTHTKPIAMTSHWDIKQTTNHIDIEFKQAFDLSRFSDADLRQLNAIIHAAPSTLFVQRGHLAKDRTVYVRTQALAPFVRREYRARKCQTPLARLEHRDDSGDECLPMEAKVIKYPDDCNLIHVSSIPTTISDTDLHDPFDLSKFTSRQLYGLLGTAGAADEDEMFAQLLPSSTASKARVVWAPLMAMQFWVEVQLHRRRLSRTGSTESWLHFLEDMDSGETMKVPDGCRIVRSLSALTFYPRS